MYNIKARLLRMTGKEEESRLMSLTDCLKVVTLQHSCLAIQCKRQKEREAVYSHNILVEAR